MPVTDEIAARRRKYMIVFRHKDDEDQFENYMEEEHELPPDALIQEFT